VRTFGYAILIAALAGGGIFLLNLMSQMATEKCNRICPQDKTKLVTDFDVGFVKYVECRCN
jgi:hypothetical protein